MGSTVNPDARRFSELDGLMRRFSVDKCVIDGLPETPSTRAFTERHVGKVFMCFFNEHQRGSAKWDAQAHSVLVNRTESMDVSRSAIRKRRVVLPRRDAHLEAFADHLSQDARKLEEDTETGIKRYKYVRADENHFSLALNYAWMAASDSTGAVAFLRCLQRDIDNLQRRGSFP